MGGGGGGGGGETQRDSGNGGRRVLEPPLLWRVAERPLGLSSGTSAGLEETGGWHTPCQVPGSGAGDLSASTALPTRYLLYLTRLSRPPESRDWGEARGRSRARAGKSLERIQL